MISNGSNISSLVPIRLSSGHFNFVNTKCVICENKTKSSHPALTTGTANRAGSIASTICKVVDQHENSYLEEKG